MLKYLKKFILDILPSVAATIIGAYIVNHYVIPAATPKTPATATAAVDPALKSPATGTDKDSFSKGVAEKAAIEKTAEKAAEKSTDTNATPDARKRTTPTPARAASTRPAASESAASVNEDHRDANELARAAIARLRTGEPGRTTATASPQPTTVAPPATLVTAPATTSAVPPLPAANDVFNAGTGAITAPPRAAPVRSADARPLPPEDIPGRPPLELHDEAERPNRAATIADDVVSTAKSMFHAVLPRER